MLASKWVEVSVIGWQPKASAKPTTMCSGPGGELSMHAGAARLEKTAKPPRPYDAWPRGGRSAATISRREVRRREREEGPRRDGAGLTHLCGTPVARITSPPSWTCAGTCPESSAWPHSAPCRRPRSPRPLRVAAHSSASCQHLHPLHPPAFPRGLVPDSRLPAE